MKKSEVLSLGILSIIILIAIAFMDYFFPGLDPDTRRRNIEIVLILSAIILFLIVPKLIFDPEEIKETPFLIELFSLGLAFFIHQSIETSFGDLMTYPFFTNEGTFDGRSPISFIMYIVLFSGTHVVLNKGYFYIKNQREQTIKSRRDL